MNEPQPTAYEKLRGSILANETLGEAAAYSDGTEDEASPWSHFAAAQRLAATDKAAAQQHLQDILELPDLESRTCLQAWHCLRALGVEPDDETRREVLGIVVEVGLDEGLDSVSAFKDRTARYFNYSGAAVIWDTETAEMNAIIDPFLEIAALVGQHTEPHAAAHPPPPSRGRMLINVLTPGGIHIGLGELNAMQGDPMGAAVTQAAMALMQALMKSGSGGSNEN